MVYVELSWPYLADCAFAILCTLKSFVLLNRDSIFTLKVDVLRFADFIWLRASPPI